MASHTQLAMVKEVYLQIAFETEEREDNLRKIEIIGIPTKPEAQLGESVKSDIDSQTHNFLEEFLAKELFKTNRTLSKYSFESLKIWLHDTSKPEDSQGYALSDVGQVAFQLPSHLDTSELKYVEVLDIGLSDKQEKLWKAGCEELFHPLFNRFVAPADPPDVLKEFLVMRFGARLTNKLDLFLSMRKNMCFDALVVEAK